MHFTRPEIDNALLAELYEQGLLTQADTARWDERAPDEGTLTELLLENAGDINPSKWAAWLCARHGFTRIPSLEPDYDFVESLHWPSEREQQAVFYGCFPLKVRDRAAYLAAFRPDIAPKVKPILNWLGADRVFFLAITPTELKTWTELNRQTV